MAPHAKPRQWLVGGSIARLLRLLVAVPLIAVIGFAGLALLSAASQAADADNARKLVSLSAEAGTLAHALQAERVAAAVELIRDGNAALAAFSGQVARSDAAISEFTGRRARTTAAASASTLQRIDVDLRGLKTVRDQVRSSASASLSVIAFSYRIIIADLLAFRDSVATGTSAPISDDVRAASAMSQAGEAMGQQQIIVLRSLAGGALTPAGQQESANAVAQYTEASTTFLELANRAWVARWEQIGTDAQVDAAQRLQDQVSRTLPGDRLAIDADAWVGATSGWIDKLYGIQREADAAVTDEVAAEQAHELRVVALQGIGILLVLVLTAVLTTVVARRITRRLRSLRTAATTVAYERLPAVVRELNSAPRGTVHPNEVAERSVSEFVVSGADEIAEVATAVRALHREAVRIAGEQAVMRANVAEIFVHLSRREQRLVDAMLAQVDLVERDETDPDRLLEVYRLDHLVTRMARINQSLLVLGGSGISRVRHEPVALDNVLRAALSQIEQYTRVRVDAVDREIWVTGDAVDEIVHLLAELLDNAATYSPPETEVRVTGEAFPAGAVVRVVDEGVGLSPQRCAQLNAQLDAPSSVETSGVRAMGLSVVARLAAQHGIRVALRSDAGRGTTADVMMPASVLSPSPAQRPEPLEHLGRAAVPVRAGAARPAWVPGTVSTGPAPGTAAELFQPGRPTGDEAAQPNRRTVNGWFKTAQDDDGSVVVTWPYGFDEHWAAATSRSTRTAWRRRPVPPDPVRPATPQPGSAVPRRLDPAAVAAAMSAYARGVAGRRAPTTS